MTAPIRSSRPVLVSDRRQARLLTDPRSAAFLHPFLARERSTAEAAREAGCSITTMAYRVQVLRDAGLLRVTRVSRRAGRPVTYYRSSHDAYQVPLAATGFTDHRDQARRIGAPIYRRITDAYSAALLRGGRGTRVIGRDDRGGVYATDVPPHRTHRRHPLLFEDRVARLTTEQAERLCAELDRLLENLTDDHDDDTTARQTYLVMAAAVPVED